MSSALTVETRRPSTGEEEAMEVGVGDGQMVVLAWGCNEDGQVGVGYHGGGALTDTPSRRRQSEDPAAVQTPQIVRFSVHVRIRQVSAGSRHSLAVTTGGVVYAWGWGGVRAPLRRVPRFRRALTRAARHAHPPPGLSSAGSWAWARCAWLWSRWRW